MTYDDWEDYNFRVASLKAAGYLTKKQPEDANRFTLSRTGERLLGMSWDELTPTQRDKIEKVWN